MTAPRGADAEITNPDADLLGRSEYAERLAQFIRRRTSGYTIGVYGEWGSGKTSFVRMVQHYLLQEQDKVAFVYFSAWPHRTADEVWRALVLTIAEHLCGIAAAREKRLKEADADAPPGSQEEPVQGTRPGAPATDAQPARGALARIAELLRSPLVTLYEPPRRMTDLEQLHAVQSEVDPARYPPIRKGPGSEIDLNRDATLAAIVTAASVALSTMSPLAAAARAILGVPSTIDPKKLINGENGGEVARAARSYEDFKAQFQTLLDLAGEQQVCVFVDDLDRCTPDVALDILEAIRVFLGETPCVFIVAADKDLIGRGLKLRYKELIQIERGGQAASDEQAVRFFTRKGQEYFEKIIQLGIPLPPRKPDQMHRFIAAQFPVWACATDLITASVGDNPRRIKQYCYWLEYRYTVTELSEKYREGLPGLPPFLAPSPLGLLLTLHRWDPETIPQLRLLAADPDTYREQLEAIRGLLDMSSAEAPVPDAAAQLNSEPALALYEQALRSDPIRGVLSGLELLSADPAAVATLVDIADVEPQRELMLWSRDALFSRLLATYLITRVPLNAEQITLEDLSLAACFFLPRLQAYRDSMIALAHEPSWHRDLSAIATQLITSHPLTETMGQLSSPAQLLAQRLEQDRNEQGAQELRGLFTDLPQLAQVLPDVFLALAAVQGPWPDLSPGASGAVAPGTTLRGDGALLARALHTQCSLSSAWPALARARSLRIEAVRSLLQLRSFVKLDALRYFWPEVALQLTERTGLDRLERVLLKDDTSAGALPKELDHLNTDDRIKAYLQLRPLATDLLGQEAVQPESGSLIPPAVDMTPPPLPTADPVPAVPSSVAREQRETIILRIEPTGDLPPTEPEERALWLDDNGFDRLRAPYVASGREVPSDTALIALRRALREARTAGEAEEANDARIESLLVELDALSQSAGGQSFRDHRETLDFTVRLEWQAGGRVGGSVTSFQLSLASMADRRETVLAAARAGAGGRRSGRPLAKASQSAQLSGSLAVEPPGLTAERLRSLGQGLFERAFVGSVREELVKAIQGYLEQRSSAAQGTGGLRLVLDLQGSDLASIPWETLFPAPLGQHPALLPTLSVVREIETSRPIRTPYFDRTLRLVAIGEGGPGPIGQSTGDELEILRGLIRSELSEEPTTLGAGAVTLPAIREALERQRPHIIHIAAPVWVDADGALGVMLGSSDDEPGGFVSIETLATYLTAAGAVLVVLNLRRVGAPIDDVFMEPLGRMLVEQGIPVVITTLWAPSNTSALQFTRVFYSALLDGWSVEAALANARQAISEEQADWFTYALLSSTPELDQLRFDPGTRGATMLA